MPRPTTISAVVVQSDDEVDDDDVPFMLFAGAAGDFEEDAVADVEEELGF